MLPSQVLDKADTLDLHVYDTAMSYAKHLQDKKDKKPDEFYDIETLERAVKNVKS